MPMRVTTGMNAFLRTCLITTTLSFRPLDHAVLNIVLPEHLQHCGTRQPHGGCRIGRPQNQAGNDEHPQIPQRVFRERNQLHRRRPAPPDCREDNDHQGQPEVRRCQADDGDGASSIVGGCILTNRRVDADWQGLSPARLRLPWRQAEWLPAIYLLSSPLSKNR